MKLQNHFKSYLGLIIFVYCR